MNPIAVLFRWPEVQPKLMMVVGVLIEVSVTVLVGAIVNRSQRLYGEKE